VGDLEEGRVALLSGVLREPLRSAVEHLLRLLGRVHRPDALLRIGTQPEQRVNQDLRLVAADGVPVGVRHQQSTREQELAEGHLQRLG